MYIVCFYSSYIYVATNDSIVFVFAQFFLLVMLRVDMHDIAVPPFLLILSAGLGA